MAQQQELGEATSAALARLASRMRSIRKASGKTQAQAAEIIGISHRSYKDYELGYRPPPMDVVFRFCFGFEVDPVSLLFGDGGNINTAASNVAEEVAAGVMVSFGMADPTEIRHRAKLSRYAWENASAKGRTFSEELNELISLMARTE